ncbi:hypothetical protein BSLG_005983 [Batrachochytrium salamandrivorans]|nr:hypothetical protein BSLG_005983 [Batrachochytrium salamandrivorans]
MTAIDAQDMDLAGHCVKVYFDLSQALLALDTARFNPTFKSTSAMLELKSITYDRHAEDLQMHETILAQTNTCSMCHMAYDIQNIASSTYQYVQHVRLIACTFTTSQNVMIQKVRKVIELVPDPLPFLPLSQGVPADKWDEVCRFEEEQAVLAQVAKLKQLKQHVFKLIADIKLKADTERVAYLIAVAEAEQALAAPFAELSHTTITIPSVDTIFRDIPIIVFNATAQHAQHAQQESENGSSNAKLEQSIGPVVAQTTRSKDSSRLLQAYTSSDTNHTLLHRASHSTLHTNNWLMGKMDLQLGDMASRIDRVHSAMVAREEYRLSKEKHTGMTKQSAFPVAASHIASSAHLVGKEGADRDGRESSCKRLGQLSSASKK